jgi:hypothetical protein
MLNKFPYKSALLVVGLATSMVSCKDDDDNQPAPVFVTAPTANRTINYTVNLVDASTSAGGRVSAITNGKVTISMNGETMTKEVDASGLASFTGLYPGDITAVVSADNFTTVRYTVSLQTSDSIDNGSNRNASSIVRLYPTSGEGTATIKGVLRADLNTTPAATGLEVVSGKRVVVTINGLNPVVMSGGSGVSGQITSSTVEGTIVSATSDANGVYTLTVPASSSGMMVTLNADSFQQNQTTSTTPIMQTYHSNPAPVQIMAGTTAFRDINYTF